MDSSDTSETTTTTKTKNNKFPCTKTSDSGLCLHDPNKENGNDDSGHDDISEEEWELKNSNNNDSEVDNVVSSSGILGDERVNFVDSLLKKFKSDIIQDQSTSENELSADDEVEELLVEIDPLVDFDFSSNPNLLPTPRVKNPNSSSAFVNSEDEYNQIVATHTSKPRETDSNNDDKGMMNSRAQPPLVRQNPRPPTIIQRPRTLADKRRLVVSHSLNYLRDEQETKIFKQIERHKNKQEINYKMLDQMVFGNIPVRYGPWKVLTWLRTREGKYIQQYIEFGGCKIKLPGSRGNHIRKILPKQCHSEIARHTFTSMRSTRCCAGGRVDKRIVNNVISSENVKRFFLNCESESHKLSNQKCADDQLVKISPRPLSKKLELINKIRKDSEVSDEDSCFLGNYIKYKMPDIKLEVVKTDKPIHKTAKKYLGSILPHSSLSEEWCEFALSALKRSESGEVEKKDQEKDDNESEDSVDEEKMEKKRDSFEFKIPYKNDKDSILARELVKKRDFDDFSRLNTDNSKMLWTFDKDSNKDDLEEQEVVKVIKALTTSVFINLNEDLFNANDSENVIIPKQSSADSSLEKSKAAVKELSNVSNRKSVKLLRELKKLNANVYKAETEIDDSNVVREQATAHLGREERELRPTVILTETDTVLLNNQERESRRKKRVPKRFSDYQDPDEIDEDDMLVGKITESNESSNKKQRLSEDDPYKTRCKFGPQSVQQSDENKILRAKVNEMLHVSCVIQPLQNLDDIEPWCMQHKVYKCICHYSNGANENRPPILKIRHNISESELKHDTRTEGQQAYNPRANFEKPQEMEEDATCYSDPRSFYIVNLPDLVNGKKGPIIINIIENKATRSDPVCEYILLNNNALIYFNGMAYYVDQKRVDTTRIDFNKIDQDFEGPIFLLQPKERTVPLQSTTFAEDFLKHLFAKPSDIHVEVRKQSELDSILHLLKSILCFIRQKVQKLVGIEPSEFINEQLSILSRDRSRSVSISSNTTSPLHFQGRTLTEAPQIAKTSVLMKEFNAIFSKRMQTLAAIVASNSLGLKPSNEMVNKLYLYRWNFLLQSFEENLIQIWLVNVYAESGREYQLLVLTDNSEKPQVEHADKKFMTNIRDLNIADKMPELARLVLLRIETDMTQNLTVLFFGCKGYLRLCGLLNNKEGYDDKNVIKPSQRTHPHVAAKIRKVYNMWFEAKSKQMRARFENMTEQQKKEFKQAMTSQNSQIEETTEEPKLVEQPQKPLRTYSSKNSESNEKFSINKLNIAVAALQKNLPSQVVESKVKNVTQMLVPSPAKNHSDFKWFLFNISDDFTYIFVKNWGRYLSKKVVLKAIREAKDSKKAVGVSAVNKSWPKIYALPSAPLQFKEKESMTDNFLIFGPYLRHAESNLLLLRSESKNKSTEQSRNERTRCLWIYANSLKIIQDARPEPMLLAWGKDPTECREVTDIFIKNRLSQQQQTFISRKS